MRAAQGAPSAPAAHAGPEALAESFARAVQGALAEPAVHAVPGALAEPAAHAVPGALAQPASPAVPDLLAAYGAAALVAWIACRLRWLDRGGSAAAFVVGGTIFAFGGWPKAALLLVFFVTSSLLSRLPRPGPGDARSARRQAEPGGFRPRRAAKEGRKSRQVVANGAVAAGLAVLAASAGQSGPFPGWADLAFAGAIAAVAADTWATEIGRFFGQVPRSAATLRPLEPGESGGMTTAGTFGGMMGAGLIGWAAALVLPGVGAREALVLEAAGALGMWVDSLLGASVQFKGACPECGRVVEDPAHPHALSWTRGIRLFDNDAVNLCASVTGALAAVYLALAWG